MSSSAYYSDGCFRCIHQRRQINDTIGRVNNTYLVTYRITCKLVLCDISVGIGTQKSLRFSELLFSRSLALSQKGAQIQLLSLNVPKVYRLAWTWISQRNVEVWNFAELMDVKCLHVLLPELKNGLGSQIQCWKSCCASLFQFSVSVFLHCLGEDADYLYACSFLKCKLKQWLPTLWWSPDSSTINVFKVLWDPA